VLTWQEHEIAELAVAGLTNKQIGEQLFLSDRKARQYPDHPAVTCRPIT